MVIGPPPERANWENAMNSLTLFCGLFAALISSNAAFAQQMNADDLKWVDSVDKVADERVELCIRALGTRLRSHFLNAPVGAGLH
jgi:hypothetical protein